VKITASIQARMGSSRLPGKVLADICGKPMLLWQIERIQRSRLVDQIVVGTSTSSLDDEIESFCDSHGVECFRGSEDDVLGRIAELIRKNDVDLHVECYGDSPLIDPQLIDEFVGYYLKYSDEADYFSSALKTTYPPGLEVTLYPGRVLMEVEQIVSRDDPMREHVGYNITRFRDKYRLRSLEAPSWFSFPNIYLEVDTEEDLTLMRSVVGHFVDKDQEYFSLAEILSMLKNDPKLSESNINVERRWKSLREGK